MHDDCPMTGRDCDIDAIKQNVSRQAGQWKILLAVMVVFLTTIGGFAVKMHESQQQISSAANKIDKALSTYIAGSEQRTHNLERRIEQEAARVDDHEKRIRSLESLR